MHYSYEISLRNAMNSRMHCDALLIQDELQNNTMFDNEIRYPVFDKSIQRVEYIKMMRYQLCTFKG